MFSLSKQDTWFNYTKQPFRIIVWAFVMQKVNEGSRNSSRKSCFYFFPGESSHKKTKNKKQKKKRERERKSKKKEKQKNAVDRKSGVLKMSVF